LIIYLAYFQPFTEPLINYIEIYNEYTIAIIALHLLICTDYIADLDLKYNIGWFMIFFTLACIVVNNIILVYFFVKAVSSKLKALFKKKKRKN